MNGAAGMAAPAPPPQPMHHDADAESVPSSSAAAALFPPRHQRRLSTKERVAQRTRAETLAKDKRLLNLQVGAPTIAWRSAMCIVTLQLPAAQRGLDEYDQPL